MAEQATTSANAPRKDDRRPAGRRGDRNAAPREEKQFEELVINIDRVARVVKGGRRFRFKALVVVGDRKNKVGVGVAKGQDVQAAVAKATDVAKKHLITIPIVNTTIPHDVETKFSGARVLIKPAAPGTGIIAGGVVRSIIGVTGINNLLSKSLGSTNKVNIAYATIEALRSLVAVEDWLNPPKKAKTAPKIVAAPSPLASKEEVKAKEVTPKAAPAPAVLPAMQGRRGQGGQAKKATPKETK